MSELLPCPFCGAVPTLLQREHPAIRHVPLAWVVQCSGCTAETCSEHRQWAIDYWNRRPVAAEPMADTYVQKVPDKCDRILWKGRYYSLPLKASPPQPANAEATEWQPIATAPKTGEHILVAEFNPDRIGFGMCGGSKFWPGKKQSMMTVVHWWDNPGEEGWYASVDSQGETPFPATHWKPLDEI